MFSRMLNKMKMVILTIQMLPDSTGGQRFRGRVESNLEIASTKGLKSSHISVVSAYIMIVLTIYVQL